MEQKEQKKAQEMGRLSIDVVCRGKGLKVKIRTFWLRVKIEVFDFSGKSELSQALTESSDSHFTCSPGRIRTADKVVNSHLLYRLSYWGIVTSLQQGMLIAKPIGDCQPFFVPLLFIHFSDVV